MHTVRIALHGVEQRDAQLLRSYLDLIESRGHSRLEIVDDRDRAGLIIVDTDQAPAAVLELEPHNTLVAYAARPDRTGQFAHHLPKPIRFRDVQELIHGLSGATLEAGPRASTRPAPTKGDYPAAAGGQRAYHWLLQTQATRNLELTQGAYTLQLDVAAGMARASHALANMSLLFTADLQQLSMNTAAVLPLAGDGTLQLSIDEVKWISAILGAGGALPPGFHMTDRLRLRRWPNLKILYSRPYFNRIAGFMTRRSATVEEIANATDIGVSNVANFVCACELCDYLMRTPAAASTAPPATATPSAGATSGLFARIRSSLGLA
ncbi:MAG TPA: hypothetical protein ENN87_00105 [Phycisphaerales bacterium]|nr:hypothetical protein [Phycisphaerales bacterium]